MNKSDFKVGQEVLLVSQFGRENVNTMPGTVKTVGRKYLTVSYGKYNGQEVQFDMTERFKQKDGFDWYTLFLNQAHYETELRRRSYLSEVQRFHEWNKMSVAELYDVVFRIHEYQERKAAKWDE